MTGPSIRNWTSSRRGAAAPLCFRLAAGGGAARERFSKFVYRQLTGEELPAGSLIESDSGCFFFSFCFFIAGQRNGAAALFSSLSFPDVLLQFIISLLFVFPPPPLLLPGS